MDAVVVQFPHLDHFLNAYMHQDWRSFGDSLHDVLSAYAKDTSPKDVIGLRMEIQNFVAKEGARIEEDYKKLFPNSASPSGWSISAGQWLIYVAELTDSILPRRSLVR